MSGWNEDAVSIMVDGQGTAVVLYELLKKDQIAMGVLLLSKGHSMYCAGRVIDGSQ